MAFWHFNRFEQNKNWIKSLMNERAVGSVDDSNHQNLQMPVSNWYCSLWSWDRLQYLNLFDAQIWIDPIFSMSATEQIVPWFLYKVCDAFLQLTIHSFTLDLASLLKWLHSMGYICLTPQTLIEPFLEWVVLLRKLAVLTPPLPHKKGHKEEKLQFRTCTPWLLLRKQLGCIQGILEQKQSRFSYFATPLSGYVVF